MLCSSPFTQTNAVSRQAPAYTYRDMNIYVAAEAPGKAHALRSEPQRRLTKATYTKLHHQVNRTRRSVSASELRTLNAVSPQQCPATFSKDGDTPVGASEINAFLSNDARKHGQGHSKPTHAYAATQFQLTCLAPVRIVGDWHLVDHVQSKPCIQGPKARNPVCHGGHPGIKQTCGGPEG